MINVTNDKNPGTARNDNGGCLAFGAALGFWLLVPFPFFLLGWGFNGSPVWLPDKWDVLGLAWAAAFYLPLVLMTFIAIAAIREGHRGHGDS